jgi:cell division protein FtsB
MKNIKGTSYMYQVDRPKNRIYFYTHLSREDSRAEFSCENADMTMEEIIKILPSLIEETNKKQLEKERLAEEKLKEEIKELSNQEIIEKIKDFNNKFFKSAKNDYSNISREELEKSFEKIKNYNGDFSDFDDCISFDEGQLI